MRGDCSLLYLGGFLDSQTGDTQFFGFTQYRSPFQQESQTEDGECQIYSSPPWGDAQEIKEESSSPSLGGSPPSKRIRLQSEKSTPSPRAKHDRSPPSPIHLSKADLPRLGSPSETSFLRAETLGLAAREKEIMDRLKRSTIEIVSLSLDACRERGQVHMLEALAAHHRKEAFALEAKALDSKITAETAERCIQSVRNEIGDLETELGSLLAARDQLNAQV